MTSRSMVFSGLSHGLWVGMTGDPTRLRQMRREAESSDYLLEGMSEVLAEFTRMNSGLSRNGGSSK